MSQSQLITDLIKSSAGLIKQHVADLSDADLMRRPVPAANHGMWNLSHLAWFECAIASTVSPDAGIALPDRFKHCGGKTASKSDDPKQFPTKEELLDLLESAHAAQLDGLAKLTDEELLAPSPEEFRDYAPRLCDLLALGPMHAMMHLGQIQVLRRALNKPHIS